MASGFTTVIFGSRYIRNTMGVETPFEVNVALFVPVWVLHQTESFISGGAIGVDTAAEKFCQEEHYPIEVIRPDYKRYQAEGKNPKLAPLERNDLLVEKGSFFIGIASHRQSRGSLYMLDKIQAAGKPGIFYERQASGLYHMTSWGIKGCP